MREFFQLRLPRISVVRQTVGTVVSLLLVYIAFTSKSVIKDAASSWDNTEWFVNAVAHNWVKIVAGIVGGALFLGLWIPWGWIRRRIFVKGKPAQAQHPHLERTIEAIKSVANLNLADLAEAEFRGRHEARKAAETPQGRRAAAVKLGGLEGAKALIEIEIDRVPEFPSGHKSGEWEKWVERMDAMLSELCKGSATNRFIRRIESISREDNSRPVAIYHLLALLNNLTEDDLRITQPRTPQATAEKLPDDLSPVSIDPVPVRGWRGWRIRVINNLEVTTTATLEIVESSPKFTEPRLSGTPRLRVSETNLSTIDISGKGHRFFDFCKIEETCIFIYARHDGPGGMDSYGTLGTDYEINLRAFAPNGRPDEKRFRTMRHEDGRDEVKLA